MLSPVLGLRTNLPSWLPTAHCWLSWHIAPMEMHAILQTPLFSHVPQIGILLGSSCISNVS